MAKALSVLSTMSSAQRRADAGPLDRRRLMPSAFM
jgi:hypothetical protein